VPSEAPCERMPKFKCIVCKIFFNAEKPSTCPQCGNAESITSADCDCDHPCSCLDEVQGGIRFCPKCGKIVCLCGSNDCVGISRVTGYMQDVSGWNAGKAQELKDRVHYDVGVKNERGPKTLPSRAKSSGKA
jgi:Anaerobic ribonucleoside-triphosphate reductase